MFRRGEDIVRLQQLQIQVPEYIHERGLNVGVDYFDAMGLTSNCCTMHALCCGAHRSLRISIPLAEDIAV